MTRILSILFALAATSALLATSALAVDPPWTQSYNFAQSPEQNGFTRVIYGEPVVVETTSGPPSGRKVEITTGTGDVYDSCVFKTSNVPALDPVVGATAEMRVSVSGAGEAGIELTFLTRAVVLDIFQDSVTLNVCNDTGPFTSINVATASNASPTTWRVTFDSSQQVRLYRAGALVIGPVNGLGCVKPSQRVLWWGESGGVATFTALKYYLGGATAP